MGSGERTVVIRKFALNAKLSLPSVIVALTPSVPHIFVYPKLVGYSWCEHSMIVSLSHLLRNWLNQFVSLFYYVKMFLRNSLIFDYL